MIFAGRAGTYRYIVCMVTLTTLCKLLSVVV